MLALASHRGRAVERSPDGPACLNTGAEMTIKNESDQPISVVADP
jgi:hypothetical protein